MPWQAAGLVFLARRQEMISSEGISFFFFHSRLSINTNDGIFQRGTAAMPCHSACSNLLSRSRFFAPGAAGPAMMGDFARPCPRHEARPLKATRQRSRAIPGKASSKELAKARLTNVKSEEERRQVMWELEEMSRLASRKRVAVSSLPPTTGRGRGIQAASPRLSIRRPSEGLPDHVERIPARSQGIEKRGSERGKLDRFPVALQARDLVGSERRPSHDDARAMGQRP